MRLRPAITAVRSGLLLLSLVGGVVRSQAPPASVGMPPAVPPPSGPSPGSGALCDPRRSTLDELTHRFRSDCGAREWCAPNPFDSSLLTSTPLLPSSASVAGSSPPPPSLPPSPTTSGSATEDANLRRAIGDETDGFNQTADDSGAGPTRLALPVDMKSTDTTAGLPVPTAGVCRLKGCRRDEYPFGYKGVPSDQIPPMCGSGTYCPDEENDCQPLIPLGGFCQLNRDDSCSSPSTTPFPTGGIPVSSAGSPPLPAPVIGSTSPQAAPQASPTVFDPPLPSELTRRIMDALLLRRDTGVQASASQASNTWGNSTVFPVSINSGGSQSSTPLTAIGAAKPMCLQGVCHLADASRGQACIIDHTQYLGYDSDGKEVVDTVSRDNCRDQLYCDEQTRVCLPEKMQAQACTADRECLEFNCNSKGVCDLPPEAPNRLPPWAFVLIAIAILSSLIFTVFGLYRVHISHRSARAEEIDRYFSEQWTFRQSILSMHAAALAATGGIGIAGSAAAAAAVLGEASRMKLLVGSPNGNLFMSPLGTKHLRVLSVDRRDSDDSDNTLYSGLMGPGRVQQNQGDVYHNGVGYDGAPVATGVRGGGHASGSGQESDAGSPFFDGRLSKRKPAPAA
ncbi:hypothetical protein CF328_g1707 [Tilletia controversa]|nr:hypothetical protein CF328_g1707 [Tilletia controversa]